MEQIKIFWSMAYRVWPPCIRAAEKLGLHNFRQKYFLGHLNSNFNKESMENRLFHAGFERAVIAWRDPGEVLSMRKVDNRSFQYHIRLFIDGEIRAHYEYSPESHPWDHFFETRFEPAADFFSGVLGEYLIAERA